MIGTFQEHICISIVIPTLNVAQGLGALLPVWVGSALVGEVVVSDGGSDDGTPGVAAGSGAMVVNAPRGRGTQLAAGAAAAQGDWLLFAHADCRPGPGWEEAIADFLSRPQARESAGYFDLALDDDARAARRLERIVDWRCRYFGLPYGDQGLLISRDLYDALGGFAAIPLMEDVEFVRRIGRRRLHPLGVPMIASARRYRQDGYLKRSLRNLVCLSLFFVGVPPAWLTRLYG
jgi:rSAM/selenodomain-associated transferase 2